MKILNLEEERRRIGNVINSIMEEEIIFKDIMTSIKAYNKTFNRLYDYLKKGFEHKEVREAMVKFKPSIKSESWTFMELRHLITNMIFWRALIDFKAVKHFDESFIFDCTNLTKSSIKKYLDDKILGPFIDNISLIKANRAISEVIYSLSMIGTDFAEIMAMSISIETFIDLYRRYPRFAEITRTNISSDLQITDIESELTNLKMEYVDIILNDTEYNALRPLIASGGGIKIDQLAEVGISGGLKPDLYGNTIPIVINSNFIYGGLTNLIHYYIDALAGRKGVILNKTVMGTAGWYSRMLNMLSSSTRLSSETFCDSVHMLKIYIKNKKILARYVGRYYITDMREKKLKMLEGDEDLVGKHIFIKSPMTCTAKDGICKTCYGHMYEMNKNINIGGYAATKIGRKISQDILSTKHLLKTRSKEIKFSKDFYKFFTIKGDEISLSENIIENIENWRIIVPPTALIPDEEFEGEGVSYSTYSFEMVNVMTGESFKIKEDSDTKLVINEDFFELLTTTSKKDKETNGTALLNVEDDLVIFRFDISNNELTKPLYDIISLTNRIEHEGCKTMSEMAQKLVELMIEADIELLSVHGEVVLKPLIRSLDNPLEFPDFSTMGRESRYQILTLLDSLIRNKSVTIGLSTQNLKRQLQNPLTFLKKETSYMDEFFKIN